MPDATGITSIRAIMVPVEDQDAALAFYTDVVGFEKRSDTPYGEGDRWLEVGPAGGDAVLALVPPQPDRPVARGALAVALATDDVDAAHAALRERGVEVGEVWRQGDPVPPMFHFADPDGNNFWVVEGS